MTTTVPTDYPTTDYREVTGAYTIDPIHSRIGFVARHAMVTKVRGSFNDFQGSIVIDGAQPSRSTAEVTIEAASVDTRNAQRDGHLRTNDFFDAPTFPQITFVSTAVEQVDGERFAVTGDLTIKGVTRSITLPLEYQGSAVDPFGNARIGFEGSVAVDRRDWGITFNAALEAGGVLVSNAVTLEFEISAVKKG